jgi:hypothetical protein
VTLKSKLCWILATLHNWGWMNYGNISHGSVESILILDPDDVNEAYSHITSCFQSIQWHVPIHGWRNGNIGQHQDSVEVRLVLCCKVSSTEPFLILCWCHVGTYSRSFLEVVMV